MLRVVASRVVSRTLAVRAYSGEVRKAGGKFSEREKALEDQYFKKKDAEEAKELHKHPEELEAIKAKIAAETKKQGEKKK
mmetsp:Transcript_10904/g.9623  ORF Transcript_10904/g.9623 Transcript_10904/m.9623 type:complete len:80 (-) Transcript_10904:9-248(-)